MKFTIKLKSWLSYLNFRIAYSWNWEVKTTKKPHLKIKQQHHFLSCIQRCTLRLTNFKEQHGAHAERDILSVFGNHPQWSSTVSKKRAFHWLMYSLTFVWKEWGNFFFLPPWPPKNNYLFTNTVMLRGSSLYFTNCFRAQVNFKHSYISYKGNLRKLKTWSLI